MNNGVNNILYVHREITTFYDNKKAKGAVDIDTAMASLMKQENLIKNKHANMALK